MILIFSGRNVTAHKSQALFFGAFLAELGLPFLLLADLLGRSLVLRQYGLFNLIIIYFPVEDAGECVSEGIFKDTATLVDGSPIVVLRLSRHPLIV